MTLKMILRGGLATAMALTAGLTTQAQHTFTIKGQLGPDKQGKIILFYTKNGKLKSDTATVTNGAFSIKGEVNDPCFASLYLNKPEKMTAATKLQTDTQPFSLEAAAMTVSSKDDLKSAKITGGKSQADFTLLQDRYAPIQQKIVVLSEKMAEYKKNKNDTAILRAEKEYGMLKMQKKTVDSVFIATSTDSYIAFDMWQKKHIDIIDPDIEPEFNRFTSPIRNTEGGKKMANRIDIAKKRSAGTMAPDFTLPDTAGKPVSLSSLRGKNVMLCFWSTDFIAYEVFTFNLARINRRLKDKNFVMLGVYYNNTNKRRETKEFIKSTLAESGVDWITLTDINGLSFKDEALSSVAKAYGVGSLVELPQAYLIGPDGKIIARHLHLEDTDLGKKLEGMLK